MQQRQDKTMRATLVSEKPVYYFTASQLRLLKRDQLLIVNISEQIVTLQKTTHNLLGQGRFPDTTLRMLVILLLAQEELAAYDVLCAGLSCPMAKIMALLEAGSLEVRAFQQEVLRWQTSMTVLDKAAKLMHISRVHQAMAHHPGLNQLLIRYGFDWRARNRFNKGYVLVAETAVEEHDED